MIGVIIAFIVFIGLPFLIIMWGILKIIKTIQLEREGKIMYRIENECQEFNWLIWEEDEHLDIALRKFDLELKNKYAQMNQK
jgi:hypothetical protein